MDNFVEHLVTQSCNVELFVQQIIRGALPVLTTTDMVESTPKSVKSALIFSTQLTKDNYFALQCIEYVIFHMTMIFPLFVLGGLIIGVHWPNA